MKKLSRKHKIALVELVVILAVAVYFFFPRPLSGALGSGFDPDEVTGVQVDLTAFGGEAEGGRTRSLSLTGDKAIDLVAGAEGTRGRSFQVTDSQAFQQSVLDFLLEQEYTEQDARQE